MNIVVMQQRLIVGTSSLELKREASPELKEAF